MKAFTLKNYSEREIIIRQLLTKLQDHGHLNCDFDTFAKFYIEWHTKEFPGCTIAINTVISNDDWLNNFVEFLDNKKIWLMFDWWKDTKWFKHKCFQPLRVLLFNKAKNSNNQSSYLSNSISFYTTQNCTMH